MHTGMVAPASVPSAHAAAENAAFMAWPYSWGFMGIWPQPWWGAVYQQAWQNARMASAAPKQLQVRAEDWPPVSRN